MPSREYSEVVEESWDDMFRVWQALTSMMAEDQDAIDHIGNVVRQHSGGGATA